MGASWVWRMWHFPSKWILPELDHRNAFWFSEICSPDMHRLAIHSKASRSYGSWLVLILIDLCVFGLFYSWVAIMGNFPVSFIPQFASTGEIRFLVVDMIIQCFNLASSLNYFSFPIISAMSIAHILNMYVHFFFWRDGNMLVQP